MASNNTETKKAAKKSTKPVAPPGTVFGVVEKYDKVPPSNGRGIYPWATIQAGEKFLLPIGSRSSVTTQGKKHGRVYVVRDNGNGTCDVYCTGLTAPAPAA